MTEKFGWYTVNNMKKVHLKQIAEVTAGYTFRSALKKQSDGNVFVLQAKNILDGGIVSDVAGLDKIHFENSRTVATVQKADVVVSSRGSFYAGVIKTDLKNTIAASSVFILRVYSPEVLPEYLAIYLNSSTGQKIIHEKATGAVINTILKKDLENIDVSIPTLEKQKLIINFYTNSRRLEQILEKKKFLISRITADIINAQ